MINILSLMGIFFWDCILIIAMVFFIEFYGKNMKKYYKQFDEYSEKEKKEAKNEIKRKLLKNLVPVNMKCKKMIKENVNF